MSNLEKSFRNAGFTLIELMLVMGIFGVLIGISTISLLNISHKSSLNASVQTFITDMKSQQLRAMVGDTGGDTNIADYGIYLGTTSYTQFKGSLGTSNFVANLPESLNISTTFPADEIIFLKGSGEVSTGAHTVTFRDTMDNNQKTININKYGVVTAVN